MKRPNKYTARRPSRQGASVRGHLSSWVETMVSQVMAEREKSRVSMRSWDLYVNDAMAHGLLESMMVEAVGIGVTPYPTPDYRALGKDKEWFMDHRRAVSGLWSSWGLDCRCWCDASGRLNIYGLQQSVYFLWKLDGLAACNVVWKDRPRCPSPIALQMIDPGRIVTPADADGEIYDGVEVDRYGEPTHVHVLKPGVPLSAMASKNNCIRRPVRDENTGLPLVLLVTGVRHPGEYRQDGILSPMIAELRDNRDFVAASLTRSLLANMFVMFIENAHAPAGTTLEDRMVHTDAGTILQGTNREIPHFFKHQAAPDGYQTMFESIVRRLGMATARGYENVTREYKNSYSASKASLAQAERVNRVDLMTLNTKFNQPVMAWLQYERATAGSLPGVDPKTMLDALHEHTTCTWLPQPQVEIDRYKAATANRVALETGEMTQADMHGALGNDWRAKRRQRAEELAYDRELEAEFGLDPGTMAARKYDPIDPAAAGTEEE